MIRKVGVFAGSMFLCLLWTVFSTRAAQATIYDYGVGLIQGFSVTAFPNQGNSGSYCDPNSAFCSYGFHMGEKSISNSQVGDATTKTGTGTAANNAQVTLGAIHLVSGAYGNGSANGTASSDGHWSDVLTIGKKNLLTGENFTPHTPLEFLVKLDLEGYVLAQSGTVDVKNHGIFLSSSSYAGVGSNFSISDNHGSVMTNHQVTYQSSTGGIQQTGSPLYDYSTVFTTYPGAVVGVNDELTTFTDAFGDYGYYYTQSGKKLYKNNVYDSAYSTSNFLDTAVFTFTPITPGASYVTASGVSYLPSSNVASTPEPSTLALFGTGLILTGVMATRKRKVLVGR